MNTITRMVVINAAITAGISAFSLLATKSESITWGIVLSASIAAALTFLVELKRDQEIPPRTVGRKISRRGAWWGWA